MKTDGSKTFAEIIGEGPTLPYGVPCPQCTVHRCGLASVGRLLSPDDGDIAPPHAGHFCEMHAAEVISEYREKLGEVWKLARYCEDCQAAPHYRCEAHKSK